MTIRWTMIGAIFGFWAVALGAFGAHGLREKIDARSMEIFQTGVHYQMFHAVALLVLGIWSMRLESAPGPVTPDTIGWLFTLGIVIFSGSLYALATTGIRALGAITPIGGLAFLAGWALFAYASWKSS